ncbi:MAG: hypothetical protein VX736_02325 [Candidatus Neomarinimicrobiota bacterium]|nr:hypothetical protein [Candidatus Neomarinimicrobiota bacterium]
MARITWALDANSPNDNASYISAGFEIGLLGDLFTLRGGVNSLFLVDKEQEFALGFGVKAPGLIEQQLHINYCFEALTHLGDTHQLSLEIIY